MSDWFEKAQRQIETLTAERDALRVRVAEHDEAARLRASIGTVSAMMAEERRTGALIAQKAIVRVLEDDGAAQAARAVEALDVDLLLLAAEDS